MKWLKRQLGKALIWVAREAIDDLIALITKRLQDQQPEPPDPAGHDGI